VLTEIGCGNKNLGKGDGVVRKEVKLKIFLSIRIGVDDASDVDNETDRLLMWLICILRNLAKSVPVLRYSLGSSS